MAKAHVVLVPYTSQGHMTPMVQLGEALAEAGLQVTLVVTARVLAALERAESSLLQHPLLVLRSIDDGLNPDPNVAPSFADVLAGIPSLQRNLESLLLEMLAAPFPPTCVVSGTFCSWTQVVTSKVDLPRVELWSSPTYVYSVGFHHGRLVSAGMVPFKGSMEDTWITCIPGLPPVRASDFVREFMPTEEEMEADPKKCEGLLKVVKESYGGARNLYRLLVNSIYELDSNATDDLRAEGVHVLPVGPLFLQNSSKGIIERPRINALEEDQTCLQWLDGREASSVLYIAFGSEARLLKDDMQELAYGLEASGHSFLWVIRPGSVVDEQSFDCILPEGFEERTAAHGKIVSWAPQMEVLAHSAIGGFMSHCGWNSTLEALCHGVPILAWPQRADQGLNKVFIEDHWKVGIAVQKHGGKVKRAAVETAIKQLMTEERGALVRKRVKEVKDTVWKSVQEDGSSRRHLDEFIHALNSLADQKSM